MRSLLGAFKILKSNGMFINVNAPDFTYPPVPSMIHMFKQVKISGSFASSPAEAEEILQFAVSKKIFTPGIKKYPMKDINKAMKYFRVELARFRLVLEN